MFRINRPDIWLIVIKKLLKKRGFYNGDLDRSWGKPEQKAWAAFCHIHGWHYTIMPDYVLQKPAHREILDNLFKKEIKFLNATNNKFVEQEPLIGPKLILQYIPQIPINLRTQTVDEEIDDEGETSIQRKKAIESIEKKQRIMNKVAQGKPIVKERQENLGRSKVRLAGIKPKTELKVIKTR
jgi:hypothetical protein